MSSFEICLVLVSTIFSKRKECFYSLDICIFPPLVSSDLALIFQPGIFSNPTYLQDPREHKIAVEVLEFLIEHQDHFVLGLGATAPSTFNVEQLTAVSRPLTNEDVLEASDSDEDLGELEVHEGGGARLGRSSTAKASPAKQKRLFSGGSRKSNKGETEAASVDDAFKRDAHTPEPAPVSEEIPLGEGSAKVRRSKTTPSRKPGSGKEGSAPNSGKSSKRNSRRKSSEAGSPLASPRESTIQLAPLSSVSNTQASTDPVPVPATQEVSDKGKEVASSHNSSNSELNPSDVKSSSNETALPTPPSSKLLNPSEKESVQEETTKEEVKPA